MKKLLVLLLSVVLLVAATPIRESDPAPEAKPQPPVLYFGVTEEELIMLAKTIYGEANGLGMYERSLVCWCILNRADSGIYGGNTIKEVILAPKQFAGYKASHPVTDENVALAKDVIARWANESNFIGDSGRTLPKDYTYFYGDGKENHFYYIEAGNRHYYDYRLEDPYDH